MARSSTKKPAATIRAKTQTEKRKSGAVRDAAENVGSAQLAGILADPPFSDRWLRELADRGYVVKAGRASYDLAKSVQGYIRFVRETEVAAVEEAATSKQMFEAERARKLKLENDKREALLVETPDALAAIDFIFGEVRTALAGIAPRLSEDVAERRRIENAIDAVLADLASKLAEAGAALEAGRDPLGADAAVNA